MFIERLTIADLTEFMETRVTTMFISKSIFEKEPYLYVSTEPGSNVLNNKMYDFDSTTESPGMWRRFLYKKFGAEYKAAYAEYLDAYKEARLEELDVIYGS